MSEVNGQLSTCERCGAHIFRRYIGEGEQDGGFTRWNKFEPYPEGWGLVSIPHIKETNSNYIRVCPDCSALWNKVVNEHFLKGTSLYKNPHETEPEIIY